MHPVLEYVSHNHKCILTSAKFCVAPSFCWEPAGVGEPACVGESAGVGGLAGVREPADLAPRALVATCDKILHINKLKTLLEFNVLFPPEEDSKVLEICS